MITTGAPVSVAIFEWVSAYASQHSNWFNKHHDNHRAINGYLTAHHALTNVTQDFLKFLVVFMTLFDGDPVTHHVKTILSTADTLSVHWTSGITHRLSLTGWDRQTRNALNYMVQRGIGHPDFCQNPSPAFHLINAFFKVKLQELTDHISHIQSWQTNQQSATITPFTFVIMALFPASVLDSFYTKLSTVIPSEFAFEGLDQFVSARAFFGYPRHDISLIIEKLKMHYNLQFHTPDTLPFLDDISAKTTAFIQQTLTDDSQRNHIQREIQELLAQQLIPKQTLLRLVLEHFTWPQ